jgi:Tol biopolymer transport system component
MNADGTGLTQLTYNAVYDGEPAVSPDGQRIAFHSRRDGVSAIYTMLAAPMEREVTRIPT